MPRADQKVTAAFVATQAAAGKTASEIAKDAGVARSLIYRIARQNAVQLPSGFARLATRAPAVQRIVTGGIPDGSRIAVSSASEMLAAADLLARGWNVYIPIRRDRDHDMIATKRDKVHTFEVRSGVRRTTKSIRFNKSLRNKSEYYAVVLLGEPIVYEPPLPE